MKPTVLIVDDEQTTLDAMSEALKRVGYQVVVATSGFEALALAQSNKLDIVLVDLKLPDLSGMEVLRRIKGANPQIEVIMITGYGTIEGAVEAMQTGAADFLAKPIDLEVLREKVKKNLEKQALKTQNINLQERVNEKFGFGNIISVSKGMNEVLRLVRQVAPLDTSVLILGESGTGKELIAHAIHNNSLRKDKPFIPVNCAALPKDLLESELFGHERGAFTGASTLRQGRFELADGGSLFLDEVGEMSLETQVKLLRVLEEKQFIRVGGSRMISVDVRIIAATNKELQEKVKSGNFRADLYYRLKVFTINIPPLRERKDDIPPLVNAFIKQFSKEMNKNVTQISREAVDLLTKYDWPGNIRELKNCIESAMVVCNSNFIQASDLPENARQAESARTSLNLYAGMTMEEAERELIKKTLEETGGNKVKSAELLKIGLRTLYRKLKTYSLE